MNHRNNPSSRIPSASFWYRQMQDAFIDRLQKGEPVKTFEGDARLEAALLVGRLYDKALESRSSNDIREALSDLDRGGEPFRIHRWLIKSGDPVVSDELRKKYTNRPEPQKKVRMYLTLVDRLARMVGDDPFAWIWELLEATRLTERLGCGEVPVISNEAEPRQRLAALLNTHAAHLCEVLDLPALWQKAEKLQTGWNMDKGPIPIRIDQGIMQNRFRCDLAATQLRWLAFEAPPYPSVRVGRLPLGLFDGPLDVRKTNPAPSESFQIEGQLGLYWELWLTIAPVGKYAVGSYLSRTPGFGLLLPDGTTVGLVVEEGGFVDNSFSMAGLPLVLCPVDGLIATGASPVHVMSDESWLVSFPQERFETILKDPACWLANTRPSRIGVPNDIDDDDMPFIRACRVTPKNIEDWLEPDFSMNEKGRFLPQVHLLPEVDFAARKTGWVTYDCIARDIEQALHDGSLDQEFKSWTDTYRMLLDNLEASWLAAAFSGETELRARWQSERLEQ